MTKSELANQLRARLARRIQNDQEFRRQIIHPDLILWQSQQADDDTVIDSYVTCAECGAKRAECVTEPRGAHGLKGYGLGQTYRFERCEDGKGRNSRVYPDRNFPDYLETCGEVVFAGYF